MIMEYEKKYKNALEWARQLMNGEIEFIRKDVEKVFPELKESEDDRIRKELLNHLKKASYGKTLVVNTLDYKRWADWLEKQGEQKPTPKHKVGDTIYYNSFGELKSMIVANVTTGGTDNPMYEDENGNAVFEKDLVEQKTPWSKEDERTIKRIDSLLHAINESEFEDIHNWLKSIKDRVQPKQEWSKEDEERIKSILSVLDVQVCWDGATGKKGNPYQKEIDWLKSLRPKNGWKPTDKDIFELQCVINNGPYNGFILKALLEQLKKLRGE